MIDVTLANQQRRGRTDLARGVTRTERKLLTGWKSDAMFSVYVDHDDKIEQSPLHEMLGRS